MNMEGHTKSYKYVIKQVQRHIQLKTTCKNFFTKIH
uniref:Uncharacterized protein n=1 Tax=Arundo donax TaxID=35708 RepID=A0A0A9E5K1_ARUDO